MSKKLTIAIDFDGTIVQGAEFPEFGYINKEVVGLMENLKREGHNIIIWTSRSGDHEQNCIDFLNKNNIPYDYVNENPEDPWFVNGEQGRKLFADYYIDDRAVNVDDIKKVFGEFLTLPRKARLKGSFTICEVIDNDIDVEDEKVFCKDDIVEVLRKVEKNHGYNQYIIYSPRLNESTVVYEGLLDFNI